ncbi:hypothetical protein RhiirA1_521455 [Rhizophagus irregularis]|uniref:F-box domain-containing protein n=1 Tax=Rhizophagus irregularis TaxID=588596 RepID=A0A2N0RH14_9GLOM|nr:hypothetical protein RhiirA1_521455 [Rhizophagus irregularis]
MSKLIPDIFALIIKELDNDYNTLFRCLLVNKLWCKLTIPILWKDCLSHNSKPISHEKNISLIKILFSFLSEESKNLLIMNEINLSFIQTQTPLFNYISYCKSIITFDVTEVIKNCFESPLSQNQKNIIDEEFYDMVFDKCSYLNRLGIFHKLCYKKYDMVNFMKLKDNLSNLVELTCTQYIDERIFYNLAEICVNIKKLELRETLTLGYSTKTMDGLHLVKLPKLLKLRVCHLTEVKELIQNTSGYLKTIDIHNQFAKKNITEDIIQIVIAIYQNCPKLEHLCIPFVDTIDDALGDLLVHCNQLEYIQIYGGFPSDESLNGDVILKILSKSTSKKLERIEMKGSWKFSVDPLKEFLNDLKERNYSLYFKFGLNYDCLNEEFSSIIQNFVDDNVLRINPLDYL